jgi:threonine aldolase
MIDLRSDTVTKPSPAMRAAMAAAEVGDDVFGEDPTINALQQKCAELTGKEAALFTPSGVMANQLAIKSQTNPSDEIILESDSHILNYETSGPSFISGVQILALKGRYGILDSGEIEKHVRPDTYYFPKTSLICLENTHNRAGGTIYPLEAIKKISELAKSKKIKVHLDGARIFNASVETGISVKEYASYSDSISFCFSKGLGAPVGSILCSDSETIAKARKYRKILGGGMRQAGILAAAGLYALENNVGRLKEDHQKAGYFAKEISVLPGIEIDLPTVQTNIVIFKVNQPLNEFKEKLRQNNVLVTDGNVGTLRAVFHLDVSLEETKEAVKVFRNLLSF